MANPPRQGFWDGLVFPVDVDALQFDEKGGWPVHGQEDAKQQRYRDPDLELKYAALEQKANDIAAKWQQAQAMLEEKTREFDATLAQKDRDIDAKLQQARNVLAQKDRELDEKSRQFDIVMAEKASVAAENQQLQRDKLALQERKMDTDEDNNQQKMALQIEAQQAKDRIAQEALRLKEEEMKRRDDLAQERADLERKKLKATRKETKAAVDQKIREWEAKQEQWDLEYQGKRTELERKLSIAWQGIAQKDQQFYAKLTQDWRAFELRNANDVKRLENAELQSKLGEAKLELEKAKLERMIKADEAKQAQEREKLGIMQQLQGLKEKEARVREDLAQEKLELERRKLDMQDVQNKAMVDDRIQQLEQKKQQFEAQLQRQYDELMNREKEFSSGMDFKKNESMQKWSLEWKKVNNQVIAERKQHELALARQTLDEYKMELQERKQTDDSDLALRRFQQDIEEKERAATLAMDKLRGEHETRMLTMMFDQQEKAFRRQLAYVEALNKHTLALADAKQKERMTDLAERKQIHQESQDHENMHKAARQKLGQMIKDIHAVASLTTENKDAMSDDFVMEVDAVDFKGSLEEALQHFSLWFAALMENLKEARKHIDIAAAVCDSGKNFEGDKASVVLMNKCQFVAFELENYRQRFLTAMQQGGVKQKIDASAPMLEIVTQFVSASLKDKGTFMANLEKHRMETEERHILVQAVLMSVKEYLKYKSEDAKRTPVPKPTVALSGPTIDKRATNLANFGLKLPPGASQQSDPTGPSGDRGMRRGGGVEDEKGTVMDTDPVELADILSYLRTTSAAMQARIRQKIANMTLEDMMLSGSQSLVERDLTRVTRFLRETSTETSEQLGQIKGVNPADVAMHVVDLLLTGLNVGQSDGMTWKAKVLSADLQQQITPLIRQVAKRAAEEKKAFVKAQESLDNIARFWNDYFPWMIIDTLTATWSEIYADIISSKARGQTVGDILTKLGAYQAAIQNAFQMEKDADIGYRGGNEDVVMHEMKLEPKSRRTLETVFKIIREWRGEVSNESEMARKYANDVLDFLRDLRPFLGKPDLADEVMSDVVPPYIGAGSYSAQTLRIYRDLFKDTKRSLELAFKDMSTSRALLEGTLVPSIRPTMESLADACRHVNGELKKLGDHEKRLDTLLNEFISSFKPLVPVSRTDFPNRMRVPAIVTYLSELHEKLFQRTSQIVTRVGTIHTACLARMNMLRNSPLLTADMIRDLPDGKDSRTWLDRLETAEQVTASMENKWINDLDVLKRTVAQRMGVWRKALRSFETSEIPDEKLVANPLEYLTQAETATSKFSNAYVAAAVAREAANKKKDAKSSAPEDPDSGLNDKLRSPYALMLADQKSTRGRLYRVLEFGKLLAGSVPVTPDYIVDLSVLLAGHSEVTETKTFLQLADGQVSAENAGLRIFEAVARDMERFPGGVPQDPDDLKKQEEEKKAIEDAMTNVSRNLRYRIEQYFMMLEDARSFDDGALNLFTPYGATSVLAAWHMLQHSSRLYGKRSLAQMICCASLPLRQIFARFCATQYNIIDKRRPTRHAHGIDFSNEIALEQARLAEFLLRNVRWNPEVRDAHDLTQDPWIIVVSPASVSLKMS